MIFVKNSRGRREVNIINTVSKINLSNNVFKYTVCFLRLPLRNSLLKVEQNMASIGNI